MSYGTPGARRPVAAAAVVSLASALVGTLNAPAASAKPAPEVEYTYDVVVRRHFEFPRGDALGYGYGICDDVARGVPYGDVMARVKRDVLPSDEQAANYVVSTAVDVLCPSQTWQLRRSASGYQPPVR